MKRANRLSASSLSCQSVPLSIVTAHNIAADDVTTWADNTTQGNLFHEWEQGPDIDRMIGKVQGLLCIDDFIVQVN